MAEAGVQQPSESKWNMPLAVFFKDARLVFKMDEVGREILGIAYPAALALAADPIASLIDTAFIGHVGPVDLAAAGVPIAIFNQISRVTIFPLVSVTTSFVAKEDIIRRIEAESLDIEDLEKGSAENATSIELMPKENPADNLEKVSSLKTDSEHLEVSNLKSDSENSASDSAEYDFQTETCRAKSITICSSKKVKIERERRHIPSASTALVIGISHAKTISQVLDIKINRFSCCSSIFSNVRYLPRIQGYKDTFVCYRGRRCHEHHS